MNYTILIYTFILLLIPSILLRKRYITNMGIAPVNIYWTKGLIFAFAITILIRGLAYDTGADWLAYYNFIVDADYGRYNAWAEHSEWLFKEFVKILSSLNLWYCTFFVIVSALIVYSLMKISSLFGKAMPYIMISWYPILFSLSLNIYRQYVSISLIYLCIYFWYKGNKKISLISLITAILFHTSAISAVAFIILTILMCRKEINVWIYIILIIVSNISTQFILDRFLNLTAGFSSIFQMGNSNVYDIQSFSDSMYGTTYTWILMIVNAACVYLSNKIKDLYTNYKFFHYASIIAYILYPICQQELLSRILLYVQMFIPITLGVIFTHYKKNKGLPYTIICFSLFTYFVMFYYYLNGLGIEHPYKILWNKL